VDSSKGGTAEVHAQDGSLQSILARQHQTKDSAGAIIGSIMVAGMEEWCWCFGEGLEQHRKGRTERTGISDREHAQHACWSRIGSKRSFPLVLWYPIESDRCFLQILLAGLGRGAASAGYRVWV
jgi:hypothetical protein